MTAKRASLIAAIAVILDTAYQLRSLSVGRNFVFAVLSIAAAGLGWTLFLLAFHGHLGQISAEVRRAAQIAAWLILTDMIVTPIYFRISVAAFFLPFRPAFFFFSGSLPGVAGLAVLAAFAFSRSIWLIRAACLACALAEGASGLSRLRHTVPLLMREWNQRYVHQPMPSGVPVVDPRLLPTYFPDPLRVFYSNMSATAIQTFAWVSLVGFLIAFAATQPRFGENRKPVQNV